MSKIEVNQISSQCGSTLTIGQSGDTVTLASGATQTGFGRTGTVDWCTTAKTAPFTGVSGKGYFVNTTCGAVTVTLPASPSAGDIISIKDYARTAGTNNINFCRNGSKMDGACASSGIITDGESTTLIYVDGTKGWTSILDSTTNKYGAAYVIATGGTVTICGDYKIHTFTSDGCFSVSLAGNPAGSDTVDYLVVAGGGGGAGTNGPGCGGRGGGGGGGFRVSNGYAIPAPTMSPLAACVSSLPVTATTYPITVGSGGSGGAASQAPTGHGSQGSNSIFSTITSAGGGAGASYPTSPTCTAIPQQNGGSGGGSWAGAAGGAGNTPPTSPPQGNPAVGRTAGAGGSGGGGAGASSVDSPTCSVGSTGGAGSFISPLFAVACAGTPGPTPGVRYFSGGGAGGSYDLGNPVAPGGAGGGGAGGNGYLPSPATPPTPGTINTGGGGGGAGAGSLTGGNGGSGIVMIRYKFQN
jgi:hypothetical protein